MTELIIVAIISAVVSLIVALLTTTLRNRADLLKVQKEQEHGFTKALFDRRVEYYPLLYQLLSGYGKDIRRCKQNLENLSTFKQKVDEWNNQHSIFFTKSTGRYNSRFRTYLDLIEQSFLRFIERRVGTH
jgi:hypothetical protein